MIDIHNCHEAKSFAGVLGVVIPLVVDIGIVSCYTTDDTCFWVAGDPEETLGYLKEVVGELALGVTTGLFLVASLPLMYCSGRIAYSEMLLINNGYDPIV